MTRVTAIRIELAGALALLLASVAGSLWLRQQVRVLDASIEVRREQMDHLRTAAAHNAAPARPGAAPGAAAATIDGRSVRWQVRGDLVFLVPDPVERRR